MNSKQRVKNAIHFQGVDRVPVNFNIDRPLSHDVRQYDDDIVWANLDPDPSFVPCVKNETYYENEWHVIYKRMTTEIGEPYQVPIPDIEEVDSYQVPDLGAPYRFESAKAIRARYPEKYLLGCMGASDTGAMLFMLLLDLFGFEECMVNLAAYEDEVKSLLERVTVQHIRSIEGFAKAGVDGVIAGDDLGLQFSMIISPDMWRRIFKPYYARIIQAAHDNHIDMMLHICGHITEIIDDLIEMGLDVLQIDQQDNMGIDVLAEKFAGRLAFFCPTDIQTTLSQPDQEKIDRKAQELVAKLGSPRGGFIAKMYPQPSSIGIIQESVDTMCGAFLKYGRYE